MNTQTIKIGTFLKENDYDIKNFYNEATEDYEFWSKDFNMHFGYYNPFKTSIFKRDSMLNEMNSQVLKRLKLDDKKSRLIDLGCGMGGFMRYALENQKNLISYGVTLSEFQKKEGNKMLEGKNGLILNENFNHTSFQDNSFDSAVAMESFCHSGHSEASIEEAHRILKPGGRLVITDAFLKKEPHKLCYGAKTAYRKLCNHWSLEKLETYYFIKDKLKKLGFKNIKVEDISLRVAPSVLHVPFAIAGFVLKKILRLKTLKQESLHNLKGSFYALASGLHLKGFGYYMISATK